MPGWSLAIDSVMPLAYAGRVMSAGKTSTVKTLEAPKKVRAKTAAPSKETSAGKGSKASEGDALDVLRLFVKTYANL